MPSTFTIIYSKIHEFEEGSMISIHGVHMRSSLSGSVTNLPDQLVKHSQLIDVQAEVTRQRSILEFRSWEVGYLIMYKQDTLTMYQVDTLSKELYDADFNVKYRLRLTMA